MFWLESLIVFHLSGLVCNKLIRFLYAIFVIRIIAFLDDLQNCPIDAIVDENSHTYFNISDFGNISANGSIDVQFYFKLLADEFCTVLTTKASIKDTLHSHAICEYTLNITYIPNLISIICSMTGLRDSAPSYIWKYPLIESNRTLVLKHNILHLRIIVHEGLYLTLRFYCLYVYAI